MASLQSDICSKIETCRVPRRFGGDTSAQHSTYELLGIIIGKPYAARRVCHAVHASAHYNSAIKGRALPGVRTDARESPRWPASLTW